MKNFSAEQLQNEGDKLNAEDCDGGVGQEWGVSESDEQRSPKRMRVEEDGHNLAQDLNL